jgi:hypothetical protein
MASIVWDKSGDRRYETGLDRGVLYLSDGLAVPWNGLISIVEKFDKEVSPIYYDGVKVSDIVSLGDFSATMKAVTYPDEFLDLEGNGLLRKGLFVGNQAPKTFNISYRTQVGNDFEGNSVGYKIHIIYNVTAIPSDTTYASITSEQNFVEFEWDISAVPQEVLGFRPTAHIIINSIDLEPELLAYIEEKLYGAERVDPQLISINDLISYMYTWARMEIIDNSDGTWTAICLFNEDLQFDLSDNTLFTIFNANATYINSESYEISTVVGSADVP